MSQPEANGRPRRSMMDQYRELKAQNPDALLFFRVGDFYELFFDDAQIAAPLLEVQLTSRDGTIPMCGVPHHALEQYLERLLQHQFRVGIADQIEDPKTARGLVDRQVVRLLSPGTYVPGEDRATAHDRVPRVAALYTDRKGYGLAVAELASGHVSATEWPRGKDAERVLRQERERWQPDEVVTNIEELHWGGFRQPWPGGIAGAGNSGPDRDRLLEAAWGSGRRALGLSDKPHARMAVLGLLQHLKSSQRGELPHLTHLDVYQPDDAMGYSDGALGALDVLGAEDTPSLFGVLNRCRTAMASRLLRQWLVRPLTDHNGIEERRRGIARFVGQKRLRDQVEGYWRIVGDLEMRLSRLSLGTGSPRDLVALCRGVGAGLAAQAKLGEADGTGGEAWERLAAIGEIEEALEERPATVWTEGGILRDGKDAEVDRLRELVAHSREALLSLEEAERERSGIRGLKVGAHRTFGYYLEVPRTQSAKVPADWMRRQTMANAERYTCGALQALEAEIAGAQDLLMTREASLSEDMRQEVLASAADISDLARWVQQRDLEMALAEVVERFRYQPVTWAADRHLVVEGMRHPLLEATGTDYVASDISIDRGRPVIILTGPNMGGKSTYMRALAQNVILAQVFGYVAATRARLPMLDGIWVRLGAGDDIVHGQSTFMVEMQETAAILRHATQDSLILLDELGRGTSTFDGMAIAWAVVEYLLDGPRSFTCFATHYHEMTGLESATSATQNLTVEVLEHGKDLIFSHRVVPGAASRSYGIDVARMAGLPAAVVARARRLAATWERDGHPSKDDPSPQMQWFEPDPMLMDCVETLKALDLDALSPREAWGWLEAWQRRLKVPAGAERG